MCILLFQGSLHILYSFTVPKCLLQEEAKNGGLVLEDYISNWFTTRFEHAISKGYKLVMEKKLVTLSTVVL